MSLTRLAIYVAVVIVIVIVVVVVVVVVVIVVIAAATARLHPKLALLKSWHLHLTKHLLQPYSGSRYSYYVSQKLSSKWLVYLSLDPQAAVRAREGSTSVHRIAIWYACLHQCKYVPTGGVLSQQTLQLKVLRCLYSF
jgi:hypothetical protein